MAYKQLANSPFLVDSSGNLAGVKQPGGGGDVLFAQRWDEGITCVDGVQASLTSDMTNANADITLTSVDYGNIGNTTSIVYVDPGANNQALSVSVSGRAITVSLATGAGGAITSTANAVVAAIAASAEAAALVTAAAEGTGLGVVNAKSVASLSGGVDVTPGPVNSVRFKADGSLMYLKVAAQVWKKVTLTGL